MSGERTIVKMRFGSHLYGTATENSDTDIKGVFIPSVQDILLGRAPRVLHESTKADQSAKNTASDVDVELYSLAEFMKLACEGQTVAIDMLFAPDEFILEKNGDFWPFIQQNASLLLSRDLSAFVGYCRHQAAKYGIKGSRVAAARLAEGYLARCFDAGKLGPLIDGALTLGNEFIYEETKNGVRHLGVCGRLLPETATVKWAHEVVGKIVKEYGARALAAERNEGIDWKALSHAVRVAHEVIELLRTGRVTFPRPERELLLRIKRGEMPYAEVAEIIEDMMGRVEEEAAKTSLPEKPDRKLADRIVASAYYNRVTSEGWWG